MKKPDAKECVRRILQSIWNLESGRGCAMGPVRVTLDLYAWKCGMQFKVSDSGKIIVEWLPEMQDKKRA